MKIEVFSRAKKKRFVEAVSDFGISKINETLIGSGAEKVRAFSGDLDREQIMDLWHVLPVEGIGLYVGKDMVNRNGKRETRLTVDGLHVWKSQLSGKIIDLIGDQEEKWFLGENIDLVDGQKMEDGFVLVRSGEDFVGVGRIGDSGKTLFSFLPKERRRKPKMN